MQKCIDALVPENGGTKMLDLNEYLPEEGKINREGFWISENYRQCTHCRKIFLRTSDTVTLCNQCNVRRVREQTPEVKMYRRALVRARDKGLPINITKEDIVIPVLCPILGIPLIVHEGSGAWPDSPSLDRIDPVKGYVRGNIWVISQRANQMKGSANMKELRVFAEWILKNI
jgi:hypothetical protein